MRIRAPQILVIALIGLLSAALLCSVLLNAWGYWQIYGIGGWRDQVYVSVGGAASEQALRDFRGGHLRLYCLGGENQHDKYTGTNDGPFEMWIPTFYPSLGAFTGIPKSGSSSSTIGKCIICTQILTSLGRRVSNKTLQQTGASRFAQRQIERHRPLRPQM